MGLARTLDVVRQFFATKRGVGLERTFDVPAVFATKGAWQSMLVPRSSAAIRLRGPLAL